MSHRAIFLTLLLILGGCHKANPVTNAQQTASPEAIPADTLITLERTVCYGTCPVYNLAISADGKVVFEGKASVKTKRRAEGRITPNQLSELIRAFNKADYFSLNDRYDGQSGGCPTGVTDNPSAITSIRSNGRAKKIYHYYGCRELDSGDGLGKVWPQALFQLEAQIDQIVGSDKWIK
ncbi:MAG: hypothetical protein QOH41_260 [Blastocatellia bacterium]|jgi:hypothetical protein|nr:hypothetical protein [Blastocatellia bacterium]